MPEVVGQVIDAACPVCELGTYLLPIVKTRQGWAHKACIEARHS